jgi:hypothetical protein
MRAPRQLGSTAEGKEGKEGTEGMGKATEDVAPMSAGRAVQEGGVYDTDIDGDII